MKKFLIYIELIVIFLGIYFLQVNFFNWFTIAGVKPNLFIILVFFIGLYIGKKHGIICGAIIGLVIDLLSSAIVGISAIMCIFIGYLGGLFDKKMSKESRITMILLVALITVTFEIGKYVFSMLILNGNIEVLLFIKILIIEILFNTLITIILQPMMKRYGFYLEEIFKKRVRNTLLTNYL